MHLLSSLCLRSVFWNASLKWTKTQQILDIQCNTGHTMWNISIENLTYTFSNEMSTRVLLIKYSISVKAISMNSTSCLVSPSELIIFNVTTPASYFCFCYYKHLCEVSRHVSPQQHREKSSKSFLHLQVHLRFWFLKKCVLWEIRFPLPQKNMIRGLIQEESIVLLCYSEITHFTLLNFFQTIVPDYMLQVLLDYTYFIPLRLNVYI